MVFNVRRRVNRGGRHLVWKLKPPFCAGGTATGSVFGYGGLRLDTFWSSRIVVAPSFSLAAYRRGLGKDLGSPAALGRFGIDLQYAISDSVRLGVSLHHMSSGQLLGQEHNPGTAVAGLTMATTLR